MAEQLNVFAARVRGLFGDGDESTRTNCDHPAGALHSMTHKQNISVKIHLEQLTAEGAVKIVESLRRKYKRETSNTRPVAVGISLQVHLRASLITAFIFSVTVSFFSGEYRSRKGQSHRVWVLGLASGHS
jgi:hypothetical protein